MKHIIHLQIITLCLLTLGVTAVTTTPAHAAETELTEEQAIARIKTALKMAEVDFIPANLQSALEITDKVGGFDNEAAIGPWVQFCKKHKSKVCGVRVNRLTKSALVVNPCTLTPYTDPL